MVTAVTSCWATTHTGLAYTSLTWSCLIYSVIVLLDISSVYLRADCRGTYNHSQSLVNPSCMFVHCGRKLEHVEETHTGEDAACKLHVQRPPSRCSKPEPSCCEATAPTTALLCRLTCGALLPVPAPLPQHKRLLSSAFVSLSLYWTRAISNLCLYLAASFPTRSAQQQWRRLQLQGAGGNDVCIDLG